MPAMEEPARRDHLPGWAIAALAAMAVIGVVAALVAPAPSAPALTPATTAATPINTSFPGLTTFRGNGSRSYYGEGPVPPERKGLATALLEQGIDMALPGGGDRTRGR